MWLMNWKQLLDEVNNNNNNNKVIVKPIRGVASESVYLCDSITSVENAWINITNTTIFGTVNKQNHHHTCVLVQEYLQGSEYALDVVSKNGHHKIAAIWKYDKRAVNDASFCYYQTKLIDKNMEPIIVPMIQDYVRNVLTALGIQNGLSHNEVIVTKDKGPVLVEVNCRQHNMDFVKITSACIGYNALSMTIDALLGNDEDWDIYPNEPPNELLSFGCMVHLVNYESGILKQIHHLNEIQNLSSFYQGQIYDKYQTVGEMIQPTINIRTDAGYIQLINKNHDQLQKDYEHIVRLMPTMFEVE